MQDLLIEIDTENCYVIPTTDFIANSSEDYRQKCKDTPSLKWKHLTILSIDKAIITCTNHQHFLYDFTNLPKVSCKEINEATYLNYKDSHD